MRYTTSRIYLLNFERTMNQIFRGENDSVYDQYIQLGIREANVEYKANEAGTSVAFVQEGELWSYNTVENTLAKVFSFRGTRELTAARTTENTTSRSSVWTKPEAWIISCTVT